jgi:membrane protease YdiL (CAAX protease family)
MSQECGLALPRGGAWAWWGDAHVVAALLGALPVWLLLGTTVGGYMRVSADWSAWFTLVLLQPIVEELAFRGVLQGQLLRWNSARKAGPLTWANLLTTVLFVAMHGLSQPPAWALAVAVPSLVFGHLRERFGSVLPAIMLHAFYNAGFALTAWWVDR